MEPSIRLYELNEFLRRTIALNFPALLWVKCEIAQLQASRGHHYLTLVEKEGEEGEIIAQSNGIIWQRDYRRIRRRVGAKLDSILQEGMEVLVQVRVDYHERFGLSLSIHDLEGEYTLGKIAAQRAKNILALQKAGLLHKNKEQSLPLVLQRLAIISSSTAAGYQDYLQHLEDNAYGFQFKNKLFPAAMQGMNSSTEVCQQLKLISKRKEKYDAVLIMRGGGAKVDLLAFDDLALNQMVAQCPLPVLVGIGHEVDETVLDLVAHQSLKTPTALADFLIHQNALFESSILELGEYIKQSAQQLVLDQSRSLQHCEQITRLQGQARIKSESRMLDFLEKNLPGFIQRRVKKAEEKLKNIEQKIKLLSPEECLKRGYSITLYQGKAIDENTKIKPGAILETHVQNATIKSKVTDYAEK